MKTQEKLNVMQAWLDGKTIQSQLCLGDCWSEVTVKEPVWDWLVKNYRIKPEPTPKLASEWFKELPEHIQWALPEYVDSERESLHDAVCSLNWYHLPQGRGFWRRVSRADYPTKAETVLATWKGVKVRKKLWAKCSYFTPQKAIDGLVRGTYKNGGVDQWCFINLEDWELYTEPTKKLASEWFKELPEWIQWALPEYEDVERDSLIDAVHYLPDWGTLPQGTDFWLRVSREDYPSRAETVLATWKDKEVRNKDWKEGYYFIPKTVKNGVVRGVDQDGDRDFWTFSCLKDWELYTEPERKLIDPVRLLGKILWDEGEAVKLIVATNEAQVKAWAENGYQWSDTVDSERHSMWVEEKS